MADLGKKPVRNYLRRREQWRLLSLVMAVGLIVILMNEVRKPESWAWFMMLCGEEKDSAVTPAADRPPAADPQATTEEAPGKSPKPTKVTAADQSQPVPKDPALEGVFELTPEQREVIEDDTILLGTDHEPWFRLLKILRQNDQATIESKSEGRITYTQLFGQSSEYRGQLVTLEGIVHRAHRLHTPRNDEGFEKYWQLWMATTNDPKSSIVVYCLDLPEGFPLGMSVKANIEVTGFFFKRWLYTAWDPDEESTLEKAPIVLAKTVRWHPPQVLPEKGTMVVDVRFFITIIVVSTFVSLFIAVYIYKRTRRGRSEQPEISPNLDILLSTETLSKNGAAANFQTHED